MIAILLIPLVMAFAFSGIFDGEIARIAEENGLDGFDPDEPSVFDDRETEFGTNGPDTLIGTEGDDALFALGQMDLVRGLGGDDLIEAGTNNDTVFGGAGDDIIGGGTGFDVLYGDFGNDALLGNGGDDLLVGRAGNDLLIGGGGADSLNGGPGDDVLISGNVEIEGEGEQDVSAIALAAVRTYSSDDIQNADFEALEASGALNGVDTSFLQEAAEPTQGGDLRGGSGNDLFILAGGDTAEGGSGSDTFTLNEDMVSENTVLITDYDPADDVIAMEYDGATAPEIEIRDRDADAILLINDILIARIEGAAGLSENQIQLVRTT